MNARWVASRDEAVEVERWRSSVVESARWLPAGTEVSVGVTVLLSEGRSHRSDDLRSDGAAPCFRLVDLSEGDGVVRLSLQLETQEYQVFIRAGEAVDGADTWEVESVTVFGTDEVVPRLMHHIRAWVERHAAAVVAGWRSA